MNDLKDRYLLSLTELTGADDGILCAKNSFWAKCAKNGVPVNYGFVVTKQAFYNHLSGADDSVAEKIAEKLGKVLCDAESRFGRRFNDEQNPLVLRMFISGMKSMTAVSMITYNVGELNSLEGIPLPQDAREQIAKIIKLLLRFEKNEYFNKYGRNAAVTMDRMRDIRFDAVPYGENAVYDCTGLCSIQSGAENGTYVAGCYLENATSEQLKAGKRGDKSIDAKNAPFAYDELNSICKTIYGIKGGAMYCEFISKNGKLLMLL